MRINDLFKIVSADESIKESDKPQIYKVLREILRTRKGCDIANNVTDLWNKSERLESIKNFNLMDHVFANDEVIEYLKSEGVYSEDEDFEPEEEKPYGVQKISVQVDMPRSWVLAYLMVINTITLGASAFVAYKTYFN